MKLKDLKALVESLLERHSLDDYVCAIDCWDSNVLYEFDIITTDEL